MLDDDDGDSILSTYGSGKWPAQAAVMCCIVAGELKPLLDTPCINIFTISMKSLFTKFTSRLVSNPDCKLSPMMWKKVVYSLNSRGELRIKTGAKLEVDATVQSEA